jgi:hypothetical protein
MNIYEELLNRFHEVKGTEFGSFTEDKKLDELLKRLSTCEQINEKYGIDLTTNQFNVMNISSVNKFNASVSMCGGDGYIGLISEIFNSDKQPEVAEMLLKISHPTGAYIFGDYYPQAFFNDFFEEVKRESNPKYVDPLNKSLYYTLENAMNVLDIYEKIHKKYSERNKENYRQEMIRRKKIELENLEKQLS